MRARYAAERRVGKGAGRRVSATATAARGTAVHCGVSWVASFLTWTGIALELAVLAGLSARDRFRQCYTLGLYMLASVASALVIELCPPCHTWDFWIAKELAHALVLFAVALELSWRVFRPVPRAWLWARLAIAASIGLGVTLVAAVPPGPISVRVVPWILAALAWLYTLLGLIRLVLHMPDAPLHRAILWGLAPYLMFYAATWGQTGDDVTLPNLLNPLVFLAALSILTWTTWRRETDVPGGHPETVRWLWPWRW